MRSNLQSIINWQPPESWILFVVFMETLISIIRTPTSSGLHSNKRMFVCLFFYYTIKICSFSTASVTYSVQMVILVRNGVITESYNMMTFLILICSLPLKYTTIQILCDQGSKESGEYLCINTWISSPAVLIIGWFR